MNIETIKEKYEQLISEKIVEIVPRIEDEMIEGYLDIKETGCICISEPYVNRGSNFNSKLRYGMVEAIRSYFSEDWKIRESLKNNTLIFKLKEKNITPKELTIATDRIDRFKMMDVDK